MASAPHIEFDRRRVRRWSVDCPAQLRLVGGAYNGRIRDLSEHGARLECAVLPISGVSGLLAFAGEEHYCTVQWSRDGSCGMQFERAISPDLVARCTTEIEVDLGPVANFGNIPIAPRRRRLTGFA